MAVTWNEYNEWKTGDGRDKIRDISSIYRQIAQQASETIKKHGAEYAKIPEEVKNLETIVSNLYNNIIGRDESDWLEGAQTTQNAAVAQQYITCLEQTGLFQTGFVLLSSKCLVILLVTSFLRCNHSLSLLRTS